MVCQTALSKDCHGEMREPVDLFIRCCPQHRVRIDREPFAVDGAVPFNDAAERRLPSFVRNKIRVTNAQAALGGKCTQRQPQTCDQRRMSEGAERHAPD